MAASKFIFIALAFMVLAASSVPTARGWVLQNCLRPCNKTYQAAQCKVDCIKAGFVTGDCYDKRPGAGEFVCCCPQKA